MMLIAIDIDGTLSFLNTEIFTELCNEHFSLRISCDRLIGLRRIDFLALPEVMAKREAYGVERFDYEVGWLQFHPRVLRASLVVPGAVDGVRRLAQLGSVAYYTARFSRDSQKHSEMVEATQAWLTEHQFPAAPVVHCDAIPGKLARLAQLIQETGERVVLIDDSYERILLKFPELDIAPVVRSGMTLVALRAREAPLVTHGLRVIPLPGWHVIEQRAKEMFYEDREDLACPL